VGPPSTTSHRSRIRAFDEPYPLRNQTICGFCGIVHAGQEAANLGRIVGRMTEALRHRGPDGSGIYAQDGIALGHRRLSIIDLSSSGAQPMTHTPSGSTISYNGEVYNFLELREELSRLGCAFQSRSDTEVILHSYLTWGMDGLKRLEGIFAFALWDPNRKRLILMRDRLGVKPLLYSWRDGRLVFGSEMSAVVAADEFKATVDNQALVEYLWYGNSFEDRTIYQSVRSLLPGHWMIVEDGQARTEPWWRVEEWLTVADRPATEDAAVERVRETLAVAVRRQLISDVPVGIFLSGGLDSSAIAYSAVHDAGQTLNSFTAGFDFEGGIDELSKARGLAKVLGLDHHDLRISSNDLEGVLLTLARAHGEPFGDAANIPLYLMSRALTGKISVVLQGDGGDEMFAGYRRSLMLTQSARWHYWPGWLSTALRAMPGELARRVARMADAMSAESARRMALLLTVETVAEPPTAFLTADARRALAQDTDPFASFKRCDARFKAYEPVQRMLLTDLMLQLPSQFLAKVDRSTMANGIEARVPLLDDLIGRLVVGLPTEWKVRGGRGKVALREAMRGRLPKDILDGPKTGFGVPYQYWLRTGLYDFAREVILDETVCSRFGFDRPRLTKALAAHRDGTRDHGFVLWKYLQLGLWARQSP
jgi:asparagine synthase (glutamine-hydrolysing)